MTEGQPVYWRFDLGRADPAKAVARWEDGVRGTQEIPLSAVSDPVVQRADGSYLYTFTSVVDDADCGITQIIRGEDHVTNTAVQIALFDALGAARPAFAHHSLLIGADGEALSKRLGALSLRSFREAGLEPMAVASHAALIGTSDPIAPHTSLDALAALFDLGKLSRAPARFDPAELAALNAKLLHGLGYDAVAARLEALGVGGGAAFWEAVRGNLSTLAEARDWWEIATGSPSACDRGPERCATPRPGSCRPSPGTRRPGAAGRQRSRPRLVPRAASCFIRCGWRSPDARRGLSSSSCCPSSGGSGLCAGWPRCDARAVRRLPVRLNLRSDVRRRRLDLLAEPFAHVNHLDLGRARKHCAMRRNGVSGPRVEGHLVGANMR